MNKNETKKRLPGGIDIPADVTSGAISGRRTCGNCLLEQHVHVGKDDGSRTND